MSDQTPTRKPVILTPAAEPYAPALEHTQIAQVRCASMSRVESPTPQADHHELVPAGDPAVIDSTATIGERLAVLLRPSTILAAGALEA